jgi:hypothetical protein
MAIRVLPEARSDLRDAIRHYRAVNRRRSASDDVRDPPIVAIMLTRRRRRPRCWKGVAFEHYDFPGVTREGDVHVMGPMKSAWFKDPDGNIIALMGG